MRVLPGAIALVGMAALLGGCVYEQQAPYGYSYGYGYNPYDPGQRTAAGAVLGAGAGAAIGGIAGGGEGAAIGALAGGTLGAVAGASGGPDYYSPPPYYPTPYNPPPPVYYGYGY